MIFCLPLCAICEQVPVRSVKSMLCIPCLDVHLKRQTKALSVVMKARLSGKLADPSTLQCVDCAQPARVWEHRDYLKPLDVEPVCYPCNQRRGFTMPRRTA